MASGLFFGDTQFPGMVLGFAPPPFDLHPYETHFAGVQGASRISGGSGRRVIDVPFVLFNQFSNRDQLREYIEGVLNTTDQLLDSNDTLRYQVNAQGLNQTFADCTFEGFTIQSPPGELHDDAGTLDGGWWCLGVLRFVQLSAGG